MYTLIRTHDDQDLSVLIPIYDATPTNIRRMFCAGQLRKESERKSVKALARMFNKYLSVCSVYGSKPEAACPSGRETEVRESGDVKISGSKRRSARALASDDRRLQFPSCRLLSVA